MNFSSNIFLLSVLFLFLSLSKALAVKPIENNVAVFSALNKITARIQTLEIKLGQSVDFGALRVTPRACHTRPPTDPPKTTAFVEVDERQIDGKLKRIFGGWMFADNPGLHGIEHPVYDVWLTNCKISSGAARTSSK